MPEESNTRASISRIVMLAEALFEVLFLLSSSTPFISLPPDQCDQIRKRRGCGVCSVIGGLL